MFFTFYFKTTYVVLITEGESPQIRRPELVRRPETHTHLLWQVVACGGVVVWPPSVTTVAALEFVDHVLPVLAFLAVPTTNVTLQIGTSIRGQNVSE